MIKLIYTLDGAATVVEDDLPMMENEEGFYGEAVVNSNGVLTKAGATDMPFAVLLGDVEENTGKKTKYIPVRDDQVFEIDVVGDGDIEDLVGTKAALDSKAMNIDLESQDAGKALVLRVDPIKNKATVRFIG